MKTRKIIFTTLLAFGVMGIVTSCSCRARINPIEVVSLTKIEVTTLPNKTTYYVDESLDTSGMVVTAYYSDNTTRIAPLEDCYITPTAFTSLGEKEINVRYSSQNTTFTVEVIARPIIIPTLTSITISGDYKKEYNVGDPFDLTGMVVTAFYSDGSKENININEVTVSGYDSSQAGNQLITITYQDVSASFYVIVKEVVVISLDRIEITHLPNKTYYSYNETFVVDGLSVRAIYTNDTYKDLTSNEYIVSNPDMSVAGEQAVIITYQEGEIIKTATFNIYIAEQIPYLDHIELSGNYQRTFYLNQAFNVNGLIVTAYYSNGTSRVVTDYTYNQINTSTLGEKEVVVTYCENEISKTATYVVAVIEDELLSLSIAEPTKKEYVEGQELDLTGFSAAAIYASGLRINVTNEVVISGYNSSILGEQTITVSYSDKITVTATFKVNVVERKITNIIVANNPDKTKYQIGEELDLTGLLVQAVYNDGSKEDIDLADLTITGFDSSTSGEKTLTIVYLNYQTTLKIKILEAITPIQDNVVYEIDFAKSLANNKMSIVADASISDSGYVNISKADKDKDIKLVYKDALFTNSNLITIKPKGYISMMKVEDDEYALSNISMVQIKSNQQLNYNLAYGFVDDELKDDNFLPFKEADVFDYALGGAPIVLGDQPSYVAIYNPSSSSSIDIDNIIITYLGGEHNLNPYHGYHYNAVMNNSNIDLSGNNNTPNDDRGSVWLTPTLQNNVNEVHYQNRIDLMTFYNGLDNEFENGRIYEFDIGVDFIMPNILKDHIKIDDAYISYPTNSYLANDASREPTISEAKTITTKSSFGEDNSIAKIEIRAKNAVLDHRGGPFLYIDFAFDVAGLDQNERSALFNQEFYVIKSFTKASESRPQIEGSHQECLLLTPNTSSNNLIWEYKGYVAKEDTPNIIYNGNTITPNSGVMEEGKIYNISYIEGENTYTFIEK